MQNELKSIEETGASLVAISYDPPEALKEFAARRSIAYPVLADPESRTIDAYGIRDPGGDGYPHPETFVVDTEGVVRAKLAQPGYQARAASAEIVAAIRRLKAP